MKLIKWLAFSSNRFIFVGVVFLAGVVAWGGFNTLMEYTNRMEFCIGCHEMKDNVYAEYTQTIHYTNRTGVRAVCADCHVPKEWVPKFIRKIRASNELYHWLKGTIDTKEKYEAKRLELAKNVWAEMKANDSHECRNCHDYTAMHWEKQGNRAMKTMREAQKVDMACVECHKGIAHKLPALVPEFERLTQDLVAKAAAGSLSGEAHAYTAKTLYMEKDEKSDEAVSVAPMTVLQVLETDGEWVKLKLNAWDREGSSQLFAKPGPQMEIAKLGFGGLDTVKQEAEFIDKETELTWHKVTIDGWAKKDGLISDKEAVWTYAEEMWKLDCNLCHNNYPRDTFNAWEWNNHMKAMRRFTNLDLDQQQVVTKYIQAGSSDMVKAQ